MSLQRKTWLLILGSVCLAVNLVIGYWVAPILFSKLPSEMAGQIMGSFLSTLYWFDVFVIGGLGVGLWPYRNLFRLGLTSIVLAFILTLINLLYISPQMQLIKKDGMHLENHVLTFAEWHGLSQVLFLLSLIFIFVGLLRLAKLKPVAT